MVRVEAVCRNLNIDLAFAFRCLRGTVSVRGTGGSHLAFGSFFVLTGAPRNIQCRTGTDRRIDSAISLFFRLSVHLLRWA
jgi:hypothetical protein